MSRFSYVIRVRVKWIVWTLLQPRMVLLPCHEASSFENSQYEGACRTLLGILVFEVVSAVMARGWYVGTGAEVPEN